ncbi:MAG: SUMF1/EgtB/PvdO family nonheme iron enzyme [Deltaproteobacteria bacterium]|nr:SUMF1/EgtB/PvdO family nonheme iron enzyme [Deltaproteobacteria bacterium]
MTRAVLLALALAGCGEPGVDGDAFVVPTDASMTDGGVDGGSMGEDASVDGFVDGGPISMDGGFGPCSAAGEPGVCIHVDDCDGVSTPGLCPGPAAIQCCTSGEGGSCDPDAMPTPNDGLTEGPGTGGCPNGMVRVGAFCIDRYEGSLVLVDDGGPIGSWSPFHPPDGVRVAAISAEGAVPQGYISGTQAAAACAEAGKRLCTNTEWLSACRGATDRVYPYGDTRVDGRCNDARAVHPAVERFGTTEDWIWSRLGDACINQLPESVALTGAHPDCVTPEGAFDMMGNLHEWTSDPEGTFRGGFYADTRVNGEGCLYRTTAHSIGHWDYSTGFRCCSTP